MYNQLHFLYQEMDCLGRLEFGYTFDGKNACIEYYVNHEPRNDWFDWLIREEKHTYKHIITESKLRSIIRETIKRLLCTFAE